MLNSSTASKLAALSGLDGAKRLLMRLARGEAETHAVLLYGPEGSGTEELAEILAQAWLCREPGSEGADGTCRACGAFERHNVSDLLRISPQGKSQQIVLKQITPGNTRDEDDPIALREFFLTLPLMARHKVAVITDAHRMNGSAANSLLKTLEEPLPHAKIVMTTDSIGNVLPTILSRCLAVACELPRISELPKATDDELRLSEGAPGRLRAIQAAPERYRPIADFGRRLKHRKKGDALRLADTFREIAERIPGENARASHAEALSLLALWLAREPGVNPRWPQLVIEAHRRIQGNGSATLIYDALFSQL
ncbi:hypothetical protein EON79_20200 [bacterium]|nr:MAG: hypothetical protein EON79_20200 [bacterium]